MRKECFITKDEGGLIEAEGLKIHFDSGAFKDDVNVSIKPEKNTPSLISSEIIDTDCLDLYSTHGGEYHVDIGDVILDKPAIIEYKFEAEGYLSSETEEFIQIAQYRDHDWIVLPTYYNKYDKTLIAEAERFSPVMLIKVLGGGLIAWEAFFIGTALKNLPETRKPKYIEPEKIKKSDYEIDLDKLEIRFPDKTLNGRNDWYVKHPLKPTDMIKQDEMAGSCVDWSFLLSSIFIQEGYPTRIVSGYVEESGFFGVKLVSHSWVEVVIDSKPYYIDAHSPGKGIILRPLKNAYKKYKITGLGGSFWKEKKDGKYVSIPPKTKHSIDWWEKYVMEKEHVKESSTEMYKKIDRAKIRYEYDVEKFPREYKEFLEFEKRRPKGRLGYEMWEERKNYIELRELLINKGESLLISIENELDHHWNPYDSIREVFEYVTNQILESIKKDEPEHFEKFENLFEMCWEWF